MPQDEGSRARRIIYRIRPVFGHERRFYGLRGEGREDFDGDMAIFQEQGTKITVLRRNLDTVFCRHRCGAP